MKKLVIFDLDGTLLNTIEDLGQAANFALEKNGFATHSLASYPYFVGSGVRRLIQRVIPENHRDIETVERCLKDFQAYYDEHCTDLTKPYPGIIDLLQDLADKGVKLAVATNKYQRAATKVITHYFADIDWIAIEGQKEGINVKPDPSVVFSILAQVKLPKTDVLYVGDSGIDMETARRACLDSVGVTWGFRPEKELNESRANCIISNPADIVDIVEHGIAIQ